MRLRTRLARLGLGAATAVALAVAAPAAASVGQTVASGPNGTAHFAWDEYAEQTPSFVQARPMSAAGTLGTRETISAAPPRGDAGQASVGVGADGSAVIGWLEHDGLGTQIVKARRQSAGGSLSPVRPISPADRFASGMTMDVEPDRDAIFAWARQVGSTANSIVQARRRLASGELSETYTLSYVGAYSAQPDVAVAPDGTATVVWLRRRSTPEANNYVQARTIAPDGTLSETQNITPTTLAAGTPRVVVSDAGVATIAWATPASGTASYRVRAADGKLGSPVRFASDVAFTSLSIDGNGAGRTVFTWLESKAGVYDTKGRIRAPSGPLYATFDVGGAGQQTHRPRVAMDPQGNATFAWREAVGGNPTVAVRRRSVAGTMGPLKLPAQPTGLTGAPFLDVDAGGKATVAWFTGTETVWARTITPGGTMSPAIKRVDE